MKITPTHKDHERHAKINPSKLSVRDKALWSVLSQVIHLYGDAKSLSESERANFAETLPRAFKAWKETLDLESLTDDEFTEVLEERVEALTMLVTPKANVLPAMEEILGTGFPLEKDTQDCGIIAQGPIEAEGLCPHHLLPVAYEVYVAYKPVRGGTVLGLSKLARTARLLAARPVLQEQVAEDIADAFFYHGDNDRPDLPQIESDGAAVQVIGSHSCMSCRGVMSNANTLSTVIRGAFRIESLKAEFYQAVQALANSLHLSTSLETDEDDEDEDNPLNGEPLEDDDDEGDDE